jgi:hydrogenase expression/formation protein HypE
MDLENAKELVHEVSVVPEAVVLAELGATAMHDVTRGGLLETLLEISLLSGVGIDLHASSVPIPPVVARFAEAFQFDPLRMISSGTLAATVPAGRVSDAVDALTNIGVSSADVGRVTDGVGVRVLQREEVTHYRDIRCEEDELARMWRAYPREE